MAPTRKRSPTNVTLAPDFLEAAVARSKETGEPLSRLMESWGRAALALPAPTPEEVEERGLNPARSELVTVQTFKALGPGGHTIPELMEQSGLTRGPLTRALKAMRLRGEAQCWGTAAYWAGNNGALFKPEPLWEVWALQSPLDTVKQLVDAWKDGTFETDLPRWRAMNLMILAVGEHCDRIEDLEPIKALVCEATGLQPSDLRISAFQNAHDRYREWQEAAPAREAARQAAIDAEDARLRAETRQRLKLEREQWERRVAAGELDWLGPPPPTRAQFEAAQKKKEPVPA